MSTKGWSSSAANPESTADVKKAARAASARLDGVRSVPMPPMVKYLDQDGELLEKQSMSDELALEGYRVMLRGRRFDERCVSLQRQGRMVTLAPGIGQEAATVGAAMALDATTDWFVPQYRELAGQLWHGYPLRLAFLWHVGHPIAFQVPGDLNMLPFQAAIAGQLPQAVGLAWGLRLKRARGVVVAVFGDGGTSQGDFHEAANLAGVMKAPIIFLCQNNGWAISTTVEQQTASETLAQKAVAYGFPGIQCDGNDLFAVYATVREAVTRARNGEGPTLVEAITYRLGLHTTADDPTRYEPREMHDMWVDRDPLRRMQLHLVSRGVIDRSGLERMEDEVKEELRVAWDEAQKEPAPDPSYYFGHVHASPSTRLGGQLKRFERDGPG
ncbi:MAG: thiamine pyrophosphate-dependent dehydrogenase E1 component subunit alpha [Chloroflexi bacterium]|nr:MAG: thiamine pyrophosphate-dependent dehydrogenase E1 component subunit alpha [Chloroflexota bacterium]